MEIKSYSLPKTNRVVLGLIRRNMSDNCKILDLGAGEGYLAKRVNNLIAQTEGRQELSACDLFPENFKAPEIQCDKVDINEGIGYPENQFDIVYSVEVFEHIENQFQMLKEVRKILKPGGTFIFTTPNILNINSRIKYLFTGFYLLFDIMPLNWNDPQHTGGHINPTTLYYVCFQAIKNGFSIKGIHIDKMKRSGLFWSLIFWPFIKVGNRVFRFNRRNKDRHILRQNIEAIKLINSIKILSSRTIIMELGKKG